MLKVMSYKPKMPKLQYKPDSEGQEGEYLKVNVGYGFEYVWWRDEDYAWVDGGFDDEIVRKDRVMDEKKFKFIRTCYQCKKDGEGFCDYTGETVKSFVTNKKVYNVTEEQAERFAIYCAYKHYTENPPKNYKVYIPHMVYNTKLNHFVGDYQKISKYDDYRLPDYICDGNHKVKKFRVKCMDFSAIGKVLLYKA